MNVSIDDLVTEALDTGRPDLAADLVADRIADLLGYVARRCGITVEAVIDRIRDNLPTE